MKKLLFIIPPYFNANDYLDQHRAAVLPAFTIPYGILSMEAYLTKHCEKLGELRLIDLNVTLRDLVENRSVDGYEEVFRAEIEAVLAEFEPDIVGVSALFNSSSGYIQQLVKVVKDFDRDILTIAGGGLPSAAYKLMLETCPDLDAICKGEGELPLKELIDSDDPHRVIATHRAWIDRASLEKGKVPAHAFIGNLDEIPPMNYAMVNLDNYNQRGIDKRYTNKPKREMAIHTSRGCPFLCVFCSNPSLHGREVRFMSVERVVADAKRMRDEFGMTVLMIEDDHFFHDKERAKRLLSELAKLEIRCEFPNGLAVYAIDDEVAGLLAAAGVSAVALAVESGSDHVLNNIIKKPLKKKLIKPAVEALRRHGVRSHVFIVTGLPGEQDEHRQETLEMLLENGFDWIHVYLAIPIFGSRLYDICVENGYIENSANENFVATKSVIRAPGVDPKKLEAFAYETQLRVNFVENYNMRIGRHDIALHYMQNVVDKYPDHAFGHLYVGQCHQALGDPERARAHAEMARAIFAADPWWRELAEKHGADYRQIIAEVIGGSAKPDAATAAASA